MADNTDRIAELDAKWKRLADERNALGARYLAGEVELLNQIKQLNAEISATITELDNLIAPQSTSSVPVETSIPLPQPAAPSDNNTDPEVKPFTQTQSIPAGVEQPNVGVPVVSEDGSPSNLKQNPETGELYDPGGTPGDVTAPGAPGVGAQDDNPQESSQSTQTVNNSGSDSSDFEKFAYSNDQTRTSGFVRPQPNVLDQFATYTWQASMYLLSQEQYLKFMTSKNKSLSGYNLLIQNSGAPAGRSGFVGNQQTRSFYENNGVDTSAAAVAGRSPAFPLDFYIDNIEFTTYLLGKGSGQASNTVSLKFQVTEPNGITFINRLYQAVQDAAPRTEYGPVDYQQANYLMVLRWYGFDENGNPQLPANKISKTDPRAIVEKYIPFQIKEINFSVSNRQVTYDVVASTPGQMIAGTSRRGTVPADIELSGKTVGDILIGNSAAGTFSSRPAQQADIRRIDNATVGETYYENDGTASSTTPPPPTAAAVPSVGTMSAVGLMQALNSLQKEFVKKGIFEYADTYEIVFAPGAEVIKSAKVTLKDPTGNQGATPMGAPTSQSPSSALSDRQSVVYNARNIGIPAGTQVLYAIDKIIRDSSFVYDQAKVAATEESDEYIANAPRGTKNMQWYNIVMEAIPDGTKNDGKMNRPVYKIRYTINVYTLQNFVSRFYGSPQFLGVHKRYPYWFTGQNVAVLDYTATFNAMYQMVVSGNTPGNNLQNDLLKKSSASMADQIKWYWAPRSDQSTAGAENRGNEAPAEAAEYLYNYSDLASTKIRIIGDPAWIQQGPGLLGSVVIADQYPNPFLEDGTINYDFGQPMFEIAWQKPQDYDLTTGLADPYANTRDKYPVQSYVYTARVVTSELRGGRFEQTIQGFLYPFPTPSGSNTVNTTNQPPGKQDPRRIDNPNGGVNDRTGQPLKTQPGVNNTNGTIQEPNPAEAPAADSGNTGWYDDGTEPADTVYAQSPPEDPDSDGTVVAEQTEFEPPPKIGESGNNSDPPQIMVLET